MIATCTCCLCAYAEQVALAWPLLRCISSGGGLKLWQDRPAQLGNRSQPFKRLPKCNDSGSNHGPCEAVDLRSLATAVGLKSLTIDVTETLAPRS